MGNYRFRLSDMIPNAWFYKLKDMSKNRNHNSSKSNPIKKKTTPSQATTASNSSQPRHHSYYNTKEPIRPLQFFASPPKLKAFEARKSLNRRSRRRRTVYKPSPRRVTSSVSVRNKFELSQVQEDCSSSDSSWEADLLEYSPSSEFESDAFDAPQSFNGMASWSSSCSCKFSSSATDIIIDMNENPCTRNFKNPDEFDVVPETGLPPILKKTAKEDYAIIKQDQMKDKKDTKTNSLARKSVSYSAGVKVRSNSSKLTSKKFQTKGRSSMSNSKISRSQRKGLSKSFAIVKSSFDPQKDFRDSMMEMIVENNIRSSKDLEELLACYLSLNSDQYHDFIIKAFEQIWLNMPDIQL